MKVLKSRKPIKKYWYLNIGFLFLNKAHEQASQMLFIQDAKWSLIIGVSLLWRILEYKWLDKLNKII